MKDLECEFEQMVRTHRSTIYTVCYMFSNDQDEVADLFQEVLIGLWKSFPSYEERGDVRSWIYRVSLNVCISIDRKKRQHKTVPLTMDIDPYEEVDTNQNSRQMDTGKNSINFTSKAICTEIFGLGVRINFHLIVLSTVNHDVIV